MRPRRFSQADPRTERCLIAKMMPRRQAPRPALSNSNPKYSEVHMPFLRGTIFRILPIVALFLAALGATAQSGNAGSVRGTLTDPSGAAVPNVVVHLVNDVSGFDQTTTTDLQGQFVFSIVPFTPYRISALVNGFAPLNQNVEIRSSVGTNIKLALKITGGSSTVTVEAAGDLVEDDPTFHTDVDRDLFIKVPLESQSSTLSSLVTLSTP